MIIPSDINSWPRIKQVAYYLEGGWKLQPVYGPTASVAEKDRGKKPRLTLKERLALTPEEVLKWFANGCTDNLGQIPQCPNVSVDLDDKSPDGRALRAFWMLEPDLAALPRVGSNRGFHLHVVCNDIPEGIITLTTLDLLPGLSAQLFASPSLNIILPPSIHVSGVRYEWEGSGIIPLVPWAELQRIFKFHVRVEGEKSRTPSEWKQRFKGDLRTLNLVALCQHFRIYGELLDADDKKHSVQCPWRNEHTNGAESWSSSCSEAVIYCPPGKIPSFKCLHAHCANRGIADLLGWAESQETGIVDRACRVKYRENTQAADGSDGLGNKRSYFEQGEERETPCPYPSVDWKRIAKNVPSTQGFLHKAFYPRDSILEDFMMLGIKLTKAADGLIIGAILPVAAALLERRVWVPWVGASLFPNLYSILIGPAGGGKSSVINLSEGMQKGCLDPDSILNLVNVSPQGLFEQFYEPAGGNPDNLCVYDEGNVVLRGWVDSTIGAAVAAELLRRYDCKPYTETYLRNKKENEGRPTRHADQTSTSIILGATYNVARFTGVQEQIGTARRFLQYVGTGPARKITWPPPLTTSSLHPIFSKLKEVKGIMALASEAEARWKEYQDQNDELVNSIDPSDEALSARVSSCSTHVLKISMIFEACCAVHYGRTTVKEISLKCLELAIEHVAETMRASAYLEKYADRRAVADQAQSILAAIQKAKEFSRWGDTIYATKSELTRKFCPNTSRRGALSVSDLYDKIIPHLQARGECVLALKKRKFEVYAFPSEPTEDDEDDTEPPSSPSTPDNSTNSTNSTGPKTQTSSEKASTPVEFVENKCLHDAKENNECVSPPVENVENVENTQVQLPTFQAIDKPELLSQALEAISSNGPVALDIETYGDHPSHALNVTKGEIRLLSLACAGDNATVFDLRALGYEQPWKSVLEGRQIIGHNLRFDAEWLKAKLGVGLNEMFCTYSAAKLLSNGDIATRNDLGAVLEQYLELKIPKGLGISDWGSMFLTDDQHAYAALDVLYLHKLQALLVRAIDKAELTRVFDLEMQLLPVVVDMQVCGMPVSRQRLEALLAESSAEAKKHENTLKPYLGAWINYDSPEQLLEAFEAIGIELADTAEETLKTCDHPASALLLEYRGAEMQRRQAESLLAEIASDGRIHCQFKPLGTVTGRFSSADPNLQNIARGSLRRAFTPADESQSLIVADYSQIELRVAAAIAKDKAMLEAFGAGKDLHSATAAAILGKALEAVTKADRQIAKAVNFGLIYGQGAEGLVRYAKTSYGVTLELEQAQRLRAAFFKHYRGLAAWHAKAWEQASTTTEGRTLLGRRRLLTGENITDWHRFQVLTNFRVQGTAADCLKLSMVNLAPLLQAHDAHLVATVHDELVLECPRDQAELVKALCITTMVEAADIILHNSVPIEVDAQICQSWGDK